MAAASKALDGQLVVLMGGSGFLGQHVAEALLSRGARVKVVSRRPDKAYRLKPLANLGQIQFLRANVANRAALDGAIRGADAVVNLVGSFTGNLEQTMGTSAGWMAEAAAATGAGAFVHVGAIVPEEHDGIAYARAKRHGEEAVKSAFPQATIIRPSLLFGPNGGVTELFAPLIAAFPMLPVFGPEVLVQPTYVVDVAEAIAHALAHRSECAGTIFELGGPEQMTMLALNRQIAAAERRKPLLLPMPDSLSGLFASLPGTPMSRDQWELLKGGNIASGKLPGFRQMGIAPKPMGLFLDGWMQRYRKNGRFNEPETPSTQAQQ